MAQKRDKNDTSYAQMQKDAAKADKQNLEISLDQAKERLRDSYMAFNEVRERCTVDISTINKTDQQVYYFQPDTFLLDPQEKQRYFRESLLKKISATPKPEPITYLGDDMHKVFLAQVADQSRPTICKKNLAMFFKRRQYSLQHLKYKVLCRWAHLSMEAAQMDTGKDAVFMFGKIEYSIEQAINRAERLSQEDYFDQAIPQNRPNTKAELGEGSLYVENVDLEPQSLLREDDIEIYTRSVSYRNKVSKVVNKFMSRLKWMPMLHRYEIFEKALESKNNQKAGNIQAQFDFIDEIQNRAKSLHIVTPEFENELNDVLNQHYVRMHSMMYTTTSEKVTNSWRCDHDNVPNLINNQHELKLRILAQAEPFGIQGSIELDHGYSFSYRVTVKFPSYFQRQCIKSQFSLYDVFATDNDKNQVQKHTLTNMTRIDTNIFRDISTTPNMVPDDESLADELRNENIKVIRLKPAAYWIDYICMLPTEPDWYKKQCAILYNNNPDDSLTRSSMNFLDVSDLASVNRINEDNALLHQQAVQKLAAQNAHDMVTMKTHNSANDGEKKFAYNLQEYKNSLNEAAQMDKHLMNAVQGGGIASEMGNGRSENLRQHVASAAMSKSGLRQTPQHLLVSYFTLRYMKSRDCKTKILYALNFCRAVQKRLCLDLREFGTRERIDSHLSQPYVHSTDADRKVVTNVNLSKNPFEGMIDDPTRAGIIGENGIEKMTVFDPKVIQTMKNMASVRMYKCNGTFNNKVFSTCPAAPKFHCTFGEPTMRQTEDEEMDNKKSQGGITKQSLKLMGRVDHIELDEELEEVYVRDDFGVYILFDCVLQDMKCMEEELIKICSYYINKSEVLQDVHTEKPQPTKDRLQTLADLLECEATFHFKKVKLCMAYLECYEHIVDPLEQQRLMQIITDLMARRPRLNLQANYFRDSYEAEYECLDNQLELVKLLIKTQIDLERSTNKALQDSLSLSYTLCNQYEENRFRYQDAEELLQAVMNREKSDKAAKRYAEVVNAHKKRRQKGDVIDIQEVDQVQEAADDEEVSGAESGSPGNNNRSGGLLNASGADAQTRGDEGSKSNEELGVGAQQDTMSINSETTRMDVLNNQENVFQQLLGLPEISIETLYMAAKEKDKTIIHLMNEHTNFIQIHEGYPEFLNFQQGGSNGAAMRNFKVCPWSDATANLDFYDSLGFINKFSGIMTQIQQELYDALKPYDPTVMTYIDSHVAKFAMQEFRRVIKFMDGTETEYTGRQYVEDESVVGNPDKMVFYAKEMLSNLTMSPKQVLDPYLIAKMNVKTINFFDFPKMPKAQNKYLLQFQDGVKPADWVILMHKQALVDAAKRKGQEKSVKIEHVIASTGINISTQRNVDVPSQLQTYCNIVELMRLRHEIILAASECAVLQQIYKNQAQACKIANASVYLSDFINFDPVDINDDQEQLINWFDEGTSHSIQIDLAIKEYDPCFLSNFNFRNPDTFKLNITDAGIEEVRSVLMYQLLQKHLLVIATRLNQLLIDNSSKAISELNLLNQFGIATPNSTFDVNAVFSKNSDSLSNSLMGAVRTKFAQNMSASVANVFYNVVQKKAKLRTDIAKEYSNYMSKVTRVHSIKNQCVQRVMRSFKVKQLIRYCETILIEAHLDAQKVQAVAVCQNLRTFSQYFSFDPSRLNMTVIQKGKPGEPRKEDYQVFKYETNGMIENFTYPYMPEEIEDNGLEQDSVRNDVRAINPNTMHIADFSAIPSSAVLLQCESSAIEEIRLYKDRLAKVHKNYNKNWQDDLKNLDPSVDMPEKQTKEMLPTMTPRDTDPSQGKGRPEDSEIDKQGYPMLDYEEALFFGQSKFARMIRFYQYLDRILNLEWFICKLQFRQDTVVHMDNAIKLGLPFWLDTKYEKRMKKEIANRPVKEGMNPISQNFLHSNIVSRQTKKNIAEEISTISLTIQDLLRRYQTSTKEEQKYEYLNSYTEFRYMQILGSFHKIIQQFYIQKRGSNGIRSLREAISQLSKMDHVRMSYTKSNSYHVNTSLVHPHMQLLESTNLIYGAYSEDEQQNFNRCVQPVINEKALEPAQLTLFQTLYQTDSFRKRLPTQFAGQLVSTHNSQSFVSLETALLDMNMNDRTYASSFINQAKDQANDFMEIVIDPHLANMTNDEVYDIDRLADAKKFLSDGSQALLLKNAIICWNENQLLPDSAATYAKFEANFRNMFFWKIIEDKENMVTQLSVRGDASGIPSKKQLLELQQRIEKLQADYSLATTTEEEHRAAMILRLKEEFRAQKKKVTLDNFYSTKAEIRVLSNEIEKLICLSAISALDAEHTALAKCFVLSQPKIQFRIHPFQQFAATLYEKVDPKSHLSMEVKLSFVQEFLTKLSNRGTEVETLTSGPGIVFTMKDFNDAVQHFCRKIIIYGEQELKSRSDLFSQKEEHYLHLIYVKDQRISDMQRRIKNTARNIENIISAKLFEKGNQLIYQLDSTSRLLILFKQTMYGLESEIRNKVIGEQAQKFKLQKDALDTQIEKLKDYHQHVAQIVGEEFSAEYDTICATLKKEVEKAHDITDQSNYVPPTLYPATGNSKYRNPISQIVIKHDYGGGSGQGGAGGGSNLQPSGVINDLALEQVGTLPGSIVPQGFQHYTHCSCFQPSKRYPNYTMDLAEIEMLSEQQARFELARVCEVMRKQRLFWRTKEMLTKQKYQNKINLMKKQLSNNAYLWDQMAESEKREIILKQELLFTQQSLSAAQKVIEKLQEEMKKVESDRQRLYKYKHQKAERLKELEEKIKKFEVYENIDTDKLINVLGKKDDECRQLQSIAENYTDQINQAESRKQKEIGQYKGRLINEQIKTQAIVEKMEQMKLELKMLESNDTSVAAIWKKKCLDLFEVCQTLKTENEELRDRCKELIVQGMQLADAVNRENEQQNLLIAQAPIRPMFSFNDNNSMPDVLPRLQSNSSAHRMNYQQQQSSIHNKGPGTAGQTSGRVGTSTANTYEFASNMGGYPVDSRIINDPRLINGGAQSALGRPIDDLAGPDDSYIGAKRHGSALGKSFDRGNFHSTVSNKFPQVSSNISGNKNSNGRSPLLQPIAAAKQATKMRQTMNQRKSGMPQTQHQQQRGKTVGQPSGPTYYMPNQSVTPAGQVVQRPGQFTRHKNRQQMWSIVGGSQGQNNAVNLSQYGTTYDKRPDNQQDPLAESSFNQSFNGASSIDKFGTTVRSQQMTSQHGAAKRQVTPMQMQQSNANKRHPQQQNTSAATAMNYLGKNYGAQQQPGVGGENPNKHNDSLFESSKASTNQQASLIRRQFNKNQRAGAAAEMQGAAIFGSKMQPTQNQKAGQGMMISQMTVGGPQVRASTKPGSQLTEITSNNALTITQNAAQGTIPGKQENSSTSYLVLGEASFAAAVPEEVVTTSKQLIASSGSRIISDGDAAGDPATSTVNQQSRQNTGNDEQQP